MEQMIVNAFKEAGFGELADRRQDELDQRVRRRRMQAQGQEQGMEGQRNLKVWIWAWKDNHR